MASYLPSRVNTHSYTLRKFCCRTRASACAQSLTLRFQPSSCISSPCVNYCTEVFLFVNVHVTSLGESKHCLSLAFILLGLQPVHHLKSPWPSLKISYMNTNLESHDGQWMMKEFTWFFKMQYWIVFSYSLP